MRTVLILLLALVAAALSALYVVGKGTFGSHEEPGEVTAERRPASQVAETEAGVRQAKRAIGARGPEQILFGDLHVHTTFSFDAFMFSMPGFGEGAHPPADACDFARYCSALDFWSINDHAEQMSPRHWNESVDSIQQCAEVAGNPENPDVVPFLGWEWTQVGTTPDNHWGHKNVVLKSLEPDQIPARPIAALAAVEQARAAIPGTLRRGLLGLVSTDSRIHDMMRYFGERDGLGICPDGHVRDLPIDCIEAAAEPGDLFRKLDEWGFPAIVIPHGTTWGFYTPPGARWDKQLSREQHDPDRQTLFEIYSGHGNSEVYRTWRGVEFAEDGTPTCPEPSDAYLPSCWRAGEIIQERCQTEGAPEAECEERARLARERAAQALGQAHLTVPGAQPEDWLGSGQCQDCQQPSFNYRPAGSAQYVMALSDFGEGDEEPQRFRFGFMSSSDNHFARPGTGYKEVYRRGFTESALASDENPLRRFLARPEDPPIANSRPFDRASSTLAGFQLFEFERQVSYFQTGGLVAVHAEGRNRDAIWSALEDRRVYGTSGPRILLWFEMLNPPGTGGDTLAMGGEVRMDSAPIFQARAVGSFEQLPGCPDYSVRGLGAERLARVCKGECYHPSDERRAITRMEVVRIRPQAYAGEPVAPLIEDPWLSFECEPDPEGCAIAFSDPDFVRDGRDSLYYVRAFEALAPAINAAGVNCTYDETGRCVSVSLCPGEDGAEDDCLAEHEPRAWSSPIFVDHGG